MDETYLSAAQVAQRLGISLRTVRRRIADGTLPSLKVGGAVRIPASVLEVRGSPAPPPAGHAAREAAVGYGVSRESDEAYIRRWNRDHWPDTYENLLQRRREAITEILELSRLGRPPSGPHDTADAILNQVRDEFGARLLQYLPPAGGDPE
jgi:excisionase family DNA binding protein